MLSRATKSSTWSEGGRDVLGGRDLKGSLLTFIPRVNERPLIGATANEKGEYQITKFY